MFRSKPRKEESPPSHHSPLETTNNDNDAFIEYARQSDLPPLEDWHTDSILLGSGNVSYSAPGLSSPKNLRRLPTDGSVVNISSNLFEGKIITRVRDDNTDQSYFRHRSRQYNWIVQGRFLKRTRFDDVITGQEFKRAFRNAPSSQIVQRLLDMLKNKLPDSFECDFLAEEPYFLHPLLAGCQHFRIDEIKENKRDELHGISSDGEVIEDTTLLNDDNIPQDGAGRRKFFSNSSNLCQYFFEPDLMYTFDFYSNFFSPTKFSLEMGPLLSINLIPYLSGPIFLSMAKDKSSGEYLWATEIWHKRLLNYEETPGRLARWIGN